jgi:hypothetical protein
MERKKFELLKGSRDDEHEEGAPHETDRSRIYVREIASENETDRSRHHSNVNTADIKNKGSQGPGQPMRSKQTEKVPIEKYKKLWYQ